LAIPTSYPSTERRTAGSVRVRRRHHLAIFDDYIDSLDPAPGFKEQRREVIAATFAKLEAQALAYWGNESGPE
jgi:hypothetical protein